MLINNIHYKVPRNYILLALYLLMVLDYILTYLGIYIFNFIDEGNPLMKGFMEIPFCYGIVIRCILSVVPIWILKIANEYISPKRFKMYINLALMIQMFPYFLHFLWIFRYFNRIY